MVDEDFSAAITQELSGTPYACASLTQLSGGTANFVYRAILSHPLPNGIKTVIVKHSEDYVASNQAFKLSAERCLAEEAILRALNSLPSLCLTNGRAEDHSSLATVKTPHLFTFNRHTNTALTEDLPDSLDLKSFLILAAMSGSVSRGWATLIGCTLGTWLHTFHSWADAERQAGVVAEIEKNHAMRCLKFTINYDVLLSRIDKYPEILGDCREVFGAVREMAAAEMSRNDGEGFGVIHGDFCMIISKNALEKPSKIQLFVVDWELCQCGPRALDLGQMFAELYMLKHYKDIDAGEWIIQGFMDGYRGLSDEMAFRTLIHVGVHFICWGTQTAGWGTPQQVEDVARLGRDIILRAWEKDRSWFEGVWKSLFQSEE
ncbi:phosphotransferase enzyme family protein [Aspergillus heteromorphus CBS 117.55]|uniref:Phosphotransferase enzyme family protein n=1 Tax=Aspergillus heteromorphus CBS 117.55 TaxID=1448321 RepID=A0A317UV46_9EURO|nr:phosphotransferase enzyme family protein [Aspergillus heteromorphus CBS 117.55]PWY65296.1 phosphotransferase enzyme family protein [Aspergillus heteromorphus CBS 117.55]